jgi:hypothetical protein
MSIKNVNFFIFLAFTKILLCLPSSDLEFSRIKVRSLPFQTKQKFIPIQIEEMSYLALIDTGSALSFMKKEILNKIRNKDHISDSEYINFFGNRYTAPNFCIPKLKIGNFFIKAILTEEDSNFSIDCLVEKKTISSNKKKRMNSFNYEATIGIDIFQNFACIFDFPHSSIYIADGMFKPCECGVFFSAEWHAVQFKLGKAGVILTFQTDLGEKKLLLDAGSTISAIRLLKEERTTKQNNHSEQEFTSSMLVINGVDFGPWKFHVMNIIEEIDDIDGLLGIEFFNKNIIGFDFTKRIAYIQTPKLGSKERFTYWLKSYF